jgi:glycosyltransferase involved in cell wall biosynthesis
VRLLWHSNSPLTGSGFGVQTGLAVSQLEEHHQFAVSCNYGQEGYIQQWQTPHGTVPLYPKSTSSEFGHDIIGAHADEWQADAIITHYDAWTLDPHTLGRPWVPWYPIDCEEVPPTISQRIQHAAMRITQTRHAQEATRALGLDAEYVPAAFDGSVYYPRGSDAWREPLGLGDRFIVACVAANSWPKGVPSRKAYPQIFEGFTGLLKHDPDALLYVHAQWNGHIDLHRLAERYGITPRNFAHAQPYYLHTGAYTADALAEILSAADVLLSPSMGEGFGVPILDAQACGTPVITGDWTAMSEITRSGLAIPKTDAYRYPVVDYGDQYLVNPSAVTEALLAAREWSYDPAMVSALVQEYETTRVVTEHWQPTLAKLEAQLGASTPRVSAVA